MEDASAVAPILRLAFSKVMFELIIVLLLMTILVPAALYDYRERRIPNILSMSGWLLGPLLHFVITGLPGLKISLLGFSILFALSFPFWLLGWMGAGDVKLMGTVGALVGVDKAWLVLLCILVGGLLFALVSILLKRGLGASYERYRTMLGLAVMNRDTSVLRPEQGEAKETMPYAIPIAFGTLIALLLHYQ